MMATTTELKAGAYVLGWAFSEPCRSNCLGKRDSFHLRGILALLPWIHPRKPFRQRIAWWGLQDLKLRLVTSESFIIRLTIVGPAPLAPVFDQAGF